MADELIRLDTTIIGIDSLINKAPTALMQAVRFAVSVNGDPRETDSSECSM